MNVAHQKARVVYNFLRWIAPISRGKVHAARQRRPVTLTFAVSQSARIF